MNVLSLLPRYGITWHLDLVTVPDADAQAEERVRITVRDAAADGFGEVHTDFGSGLHGSEPISDLVLRCLLEQLPQHPLSLAWRQEQGLVPVRLVESAVEQLGETVHQALRKHEKLTASAVLGSALELLGPRDLAMLFTNTRAALRGLPPATLTRHQIGTTLHESWTRTALSLRFPRPEFTKPPHISDTVHHAYAIQMLLLGCYLTDVEDWVDTAAALLCEPVSPGSAVQATADSLSR